MYSEKTSLMNKYDLNLQQLDYDFIKNCKDVKVLEKILQVLRSGEEGVFPDLTSFCERSLQQLNPNSKFLNLPKNILKFSDLTKSERIEIETCIDNWTHLDDEIKCLQQEIVTNDLPPVRGTSIKLDSTIMRKSPEGIVSAKKHKPRTYAEWDKFNVEEELEKLDVKENDPPKNIPERKSELSQCILNPGITEKNRKYIAELEKNKGNEAFKAGDYEEAVVYYTRSLSAFKNIASLNNRAQTYLKMKNYCETIKDCNTVLMMEPDNIKALYRRGIAYKEEHIYDFAKQDFKLILELDPENKLAKNQLKDIKHLKLTKTNKKKVLIEEVAQNQNVAKGRDANKGTRLTIEEVSSNCNPLKISEIDSSSEDENPTAQLPQKVKNMLKINQNSKTAKSKNLNMIEKADLRETTTKKLSLIEEFKEDTKSKQNVKNRDIKSLDNKFVNIKIECDANDYKYTESNDTKNESHHSIHNNHKQPTENRENLNEEDKEKLENITSDMNNLNLSKTEQIMLKKNNSDENELECNQSNGYRHFEGSKENIEICSNPPDDANIEVTPYQFLLTWTSENANNDSNIGAKYLLKIKPEELPKVVTDKLDGSLLYGLLKAIFIIYQLGKHKEGNKYLFFLSQVPRIKIASLFLSDEETKNIKHLFLKLDDREMVQTYLQKILCN